MDERLRESISALMDDESNELELKRILSHGDNDEVKAQWTRYHEVRQVMQQDEGRHFNIDISAGVAAAIREDSDSEIESALPERNTKASVTALNHASRKDMTSLPAEHKISGRAWLALAASVAFAFAFTFQGTGDQIGDNVTTIASSPVSDSALVKVGSAVEPKVTVEMTEEQARHFGKYLLRHAEHSVRGTQSGFMPLARVASVNSVGI